MEHPIQQGIEEGAFGAAFFLTSVFVVIYSIADNSNMFILWFLPAVICLVLYTVIKNIYEDKEKKGKDSVPRARQDEQGL